MAKLLQNNRPWLKPRGGSYLTTPGGMRVSFMQTVLVPSCPKPLVRLQPAQVTECLVALRRHFPLQHPLR
eukprot:11204571-Lingulodinium_polyedra.AAC.1